MLQAIQVCHSLAVTNAGHVCPLQHRSDLDMSSDCQIALKAYVMSHLAAVGTSTDSVWSKTCGLAKEHIYTAARQQHYAKLVLLFCQMHAACPLCACSVKCRGVCRSAFELTLTCVRGGSRPLSSLSCKEALKGSTMCWPDWLRDLNGDSIAMAVSRPCTCSSEPIRTMLMMQYGL